MDPPVFDEIGSGWKEPLDFVFIDGDHSESVCEEDWLNFAPHVMPGGRVAFHDSALYVGGHTDEYDGPFASAIGTFVMRRPA